MKGGCTTAPACGGGASSAAPVAPTKRHLGPPLSRRPSPHTPLLPNSPPAAAGNFNLSSPFGIFRHAEGANLSLAVRSPSGIVYYRQQPPATDTTSSGGSLSAGAIAGKAVQPVQAWRCDCWCASGRLAPLHGRQQQLCLMLSHVCASWPPPGAGIAVGAAVVALAAAGGGWVLLRRRRRGGPADAVAPVDAAKAESGSKASTAWSPGLPPSGPPSGRLRVSSPLLNTAAQLPAVLAEAGLAAQQGSAQQSWQSSHKSHASTGKGNSGSVRKSVVTSGQLPCGRPIAASPFARRQGPPGGQGLSPASTATPPEAGAPWQPPPPGAVLAELVAQRALEDVAPPCEGYTVGGASAYTGGSLSGSTGASGGTTSLSGGREEGGALGPDALPASLIDWLIPAEDIQILERPGRPGEDWVLGEGARCGAHAACALCCRGPHACSAREPGRRAAGGGAASLPPHLASPRPIVQPLHPMRAPAMQRRGLQGHISRRHSGSERD